MTSPYQPNQPSGQAQQPTYGQPPHNQPSYGQQAYGQPAYGAPQYGPATGYGPSGGMYPPQPEAPKPDTLGIVGLVLVVASAILMCVLTFGVTQSFAELVVDLIRRGSNPDLIQTDPAFQQFIQSVSWQTALITLASVVGLGGWIVSIIAVAQAKGRTYGIWGIVIGVLAPIIATMIFTIIYMGALSQLVS